MVAGIDPSPSRRATGSARWVTIGLASAALAACVTAPPAPQAVAALRLPSEDPQGQSRFYEGSAADEVARAATKVLRIAGYSVFPNPQGFVAAPPRVTMWSRHSSFGPAPWTFWTVNIAAGAEGVEVHADLRDQYGGQPYGRDGSAYAIFFDRLDYLLKRRSTWMTCEQAAAIWTGGTRETGTRNPLAMQSAAPPAQTTRTRLFSPARHAAAAPSHRSAPARC